MATEKQLRLWEEKQRDVIIKIFEKLGLRPDLQMLKIEVLGKAGGYLWYSDMLEADVKELEKIIHKEYFDRYPDDVFLTHIEQLLNDEEKRVIKAKFGIGKDGVRVSSKVAGEIAGVSSRKVPHVRKRAVEKLKEAYEEYRYNKTNPLDL